MLFTILGQFIYLEAGEFILNGQMLINRGNIVVGGGYCVLWTEYTDSTLVYPCKSLRASYFMD